MKIGMNCSPMFASLGTQCLWNEKQVGNQNSLKQKLKAFFIPIISLYYKNSKFLRHFLEI